MANIDTETYSVLRQGGASPARACAELGVRIGRRDHLEKLFQARRAAGEQRLERPRFAFHRKHVTAVRAAGGFPVLSR